MYLTRNRKHRESLPGRNNRHEPAKKHSVLQLEGWGTKEHKIFQSCAYKAILFVFTLSYGFICVYYKMYSKLFRYSVGHCNFTSTTLHHFEGQNHNFSAECLAHNLYIANHIPLTYFTVSDCNEH
jgi:hypothetical protein